MAVMWLHDNCSSSRLEQSAQWDVVKVKLPVTHIWFQIKSELFVDSYFVIQWPPSKTLDDIFLIRKNLDDSKVYGWDNISIRMIKLCGITISILLKLIFKSMLEEGIFPNDWKKN